MIQKQELRTLLLLEFTKAIIQNIKYEKKSEELVPSRPIVSSQIPISIPIQLPKPRVPIKIERIERLISRPLLKSNKPITRSLDSQTGFEMSIISPPVAENKLEKIKPLLNDPSIRSIECSGPEKNLIINRQGIIQSANLSLNQSEISSIVEEVSNKTRIPLVAGTFKAAFDNFIMTAIISEFVGTRFLIQRKPMAPLQMPQMQKTSNVNPQIQPPQRYHNSNEVPRPSK